LYEPITGGKYIDIEANREAIGRYGLSIDDVNNVVEAAIGGMTLTTTIEGRQRFLYAYMHKSIEIVLKT
jgi:Cu(I)/Ag(I) efflux system membrane protein CusA/SilA